MATHTPVRFGDLLRRFIHRAGPSENRLAEKIELSRTAVNNWCNHLSLPDPRHRHKVLGGARFLRLTEDETNALLRAAGMAAEYPLGDDSAGLLRSDLLAEPFRRLERARPYPVLLLLSPSGWGEPPFREALLAQARKRFGSADVLHVQPPYVADIGPEDYFRALGRQCGFDAVKDGFGFERALEERLRERVLFLLVSRFEQGTGEARRTLAGIFRSLSERWEERLHLILCGGEHLAELKYESRDLSLLSAAGVLHWPELGADDVLNLHRGRYPELGLSREQAGWFLDISGGHPQLLEAALRLRAAEPGLDPARYPIRLSREDCLWARFGPLANHQPSRRALARLLKRPRVGDAPPYLFDPLLRRLYWTNLLAEHRDADGPWLGWRCEAVRLAGLQVLAALPTATGLSEGGP